MRISEKPTVAELHGIFFIGTSTSRRGFFFRYSGSSGLATLFKNPGGSGGPGGPSPPGNGGGGGGGGGGQLPAIDW